MSLTYAARVTANTGTDAEVAVAAAQAGAAVVRAMFGSALARFDKSGGDFATGIALCQAAGCVVTDIDGQPLDAGTGGLIAAADRQTHAVLLEMITNPTAPRR